MTYQMALMMNWLMLAAGLLATDMFSGLWDGSWFGDDTDDDDAMAGPLGDNLGLGAGDDDYTGTDADDVVLGQLGDDTIDGGAGDDMIEGNTGDDTLLGGLGNDTLAGGGDTDTIFGGAGSDLLSSDRVDGDADWTRGDAEALDGGEGDDRLYFSNADMATGGAGADSFGMIQSGGDAAQITDFDPSEDSVTIYVDGLNTASEAPLISYNADPDAGTTTVSLDGDATLVFDGLFTPEELGVVLVDMEDIDFEGVS